MHFRSPQVTALKALSEFCLLHGATVPLLLKKDSELWAKAHPQPPQPQHLSTTPLASHKKATGSGGGSNATAGGGSTQQHQHRAGALIKQLLHRHLLESESPVMPSIAERASLLLQVAT